jgi:hypothetical protein
VNSPNLAKGIPTPFPDVLARPARVRGPQIDEIPFIFPVIREFDA